MSNKDASEKLPRKVYEKELRKLQEELCHLQDWIKASGERVIVVLEGRDAAGKGGLTRFAAAGGPPEGWILSSVHTFFGFGTEVPGEGFAGCWANAIPAIASSTAAQNKKRAKLTWKRGTGIIGTPLF